MAKPNFKKQAKNILYERPEHKGYEYWLVDVEKEIEKALKRVYEQGKQYGKNARYHTRFAVNNIQNKTKKKLLEEIENKYFKFWENFKLNPAVIIEKKDFEKLKKKHLKE